MAQLSDICTVDLVACQIVQFSASVGFKLRRASVLPKTFGGKNMQPFISGVQPPAGLSADLSEKEYIHEWLRTITHDCADELLASGLMEVLDPTLLLCNTASRNFLVASKLLLERGADLQHVELRRCRRRSLVDIAAHAASLDDDWRLVLFLLRQGANAISPQGVLFTPLRRGNVTKARELLDAGVQCDEDALCSLLCDMCSHGQLPAMVLLVDELRVPVNRKNTRDGLTGTDRALAWHRWSAAEWLISHRRGMPSKKNMALGNLLDSSSDPVVARILDILMTRNFFTTLDVLSAAVQRGDIALCEHLVARSACSFIEPVDVVDSALCHGHLRIALVLLRRGIQPKRLSKCRADAWLHGGTQHDVAEQILSLLPADSSLREAFPLMRQKQPQSCATSVVDVLGVAGIEPHPSHIMNLTPDASCLELVPF